MIEKVKAAAAWLWDWAKRIFGRSKIIFTNAMGILLAGWVEMYDPISMFNWDSITDKHEVAIGIGIGIQVLNMILRQWYSSGPTNFGKKEAVVEDEIVPDENAEQTSPKAQ